MSKELEALNRLKTFCLSETGMPYKMYSLSAPVIEEDASIVEQALKRNEPVRLQIHNYDGEFVEAKSSSDFLSDEWCLPMGYCPICGEQNPIDFNFCGNCGNKLDNDWSEKK